MSKHHSSATIISTLDTLKPRLLPGLPPSWVRCKQFDPIVKDLNSRNQKASAGGEKLFSEVAYTINDALFTHWSLTPWHRLRRQRCHLQREVLHNACSLKQSQLPFTCDFTLTSFSFLECLLILLEVRRRRRDCLAEEVRARATGDLLARSSIMSWLNSATLLTSSSSLLSDSESSLSPDKRICIVQVFYETT